MNPPTAYGGQAVIEGVMIRGRRTVALACRLPSGQIHRYREPLRSALLQSRVARAPFVRGLVVLYESLSYGMRMLMRSADIQVDEKDREGGGGLSTTLVMGIALVLALVVFVGIPYLATQLLHAVLPSTLALNLAEGALRMALFLGYLGAISFMPDIRRVFAYHGAEHMTIHAFEHGDPLTPESVEPYPTAHPRCGTAFLLADEAGTNPVHRAALSDPQFTETVLTRAFTGRYARGLHNRFIDDHEAQAPCGFPAVASMTSPIQAASVNAGDPHGTSLWAGTQFRQAMAGTTAAIMAALVP